MSRHRGRRRAISSAQRENLAHVYVLRLYAAALAPRSELQVLKNNLRPIAAIIGRTERSLRRLPKPRLRALVATHYARAEEAASVSSFRTRIAEFGQLLNLADSERAILALAIAAAANRQLDSLAEHVPPSPAMFAKFVAAATGMTEDDVRSALEPDSILVGSGLLELGEDNGFDVISLRLKVLDGVGASLCESSARFSPLDGRFLVTVPAGSLTLDSYAHLRKEADLGIAVLRGALQARKPGVHILLYGQPGTGKTELARAVVQALGVRGYAVQDLDSATSGIL